MDEKWRQPAPMRSLFAPKQRLAQCDPVEDTSYSRPTLARAAALPLADTLV